MALFAGILYMSCTETPSIEQLVRNWESPLVLYLIERATDDDETQNTNANCIQLSLAQLSTAPHITYIIS